MGTKKKPAKDPLDIMKAWRGVPTTDYNAVFLLAQAPLDEAGQAYAALRKLKVRGDVLGRTIKLTNPCYVAYQFKGHTWSNIESPLSLPGIDQAWPAEADARQLSRTLKSRVLWWARSDTGGTFAYALYEKHKLLERYDDGTRPQDPPSFKSTLRPGAKPPAGKTFPKWLHDFAVSLDLLTPLFSLASWYGWPGPGQSVTLDAFDEFGSQYLVRADYLSK